MHRWLGTHPNGMSRVGIKDEYPLDPSYDSPEGDDTSNSSGSTFDDSQSLIEYAKSNPTLHCGAQQKYVQGVDFPPESFERTECSVDSGPSL